MPRKIWMLAALCVLVLLSGSSLPASIASAQGVIEPELEACPYISSRCCFTEVDSSTGCPYCVCYLGQGCC
jgi:hypothetical protein